MSRELKFRAWDGKEMHLPEYADKEDFHLLPDGTIVETHEHGYERHELTSPRGDNWIVMQYTGLKDKNGKEIYEGDVIISHGFVNTGYIVEWKDFHGWCLRYPENKDAIWLNNQTWENAEVIGNIYEHPHLLNPDHVPELHPK